jgi:hypothetical protein
VRWCARKNQNQKTQKTKAVSIKTKTEHALSMRLSNIKQAARRMDSACSMRDLFRTISINKIKKPHPSP